MTARILIADEISTNRIGISATLGASDYDLTEARTGAEALRAAGSGRIDLAVIGDTIAGPDALGFCRQMKDGDATCNIPVILIATGGAAATRLAAMRAGADEVLARPPDPAVLMARVRNLLRTRTLAAEVAHRQKTALDLGFAESPAEFRRPALILAVGQCGAPAETAAALANVPHARVESVDRKRLFARAGSGTPVDMVFLTSGPGTSLTNLNLVAELRSRRETRHTAIVLEYESKDLARAVSALDLGANDLIEAGAPAAELCLRAQTQLRLKLQSDRLRNAMETGMHLAVTDPLTGLYNRRYALPHLVRLAAHAVATRTPFAVMLLDLDLFKQVNDRHGHAAGDAVLAEIAGRIRRNLRSVDLVARIGGEEFLVALPDTELAAARAAAERLRRVTEQRPVTLPDGQGEVAVTLSIGLASAGQSRAQALDPDDLMARADRALRSAKAHGRNKVDCVQIAA